MAQNVNHFPQVLYRSWIGEFADEYALAMNEGHPLLGGFDCAQYEADRARFCERVDSPDKLFEIVALRYGGPAHEET
jgi:hypothetical protein